MSVRLAVDIGGTFTDVVLDVDGQLSTVKVLTTYDDPARAVLEGARQVAQEAGVALADVELVLHGTTLATNALIERRGAKTALVTTEGHRDVIEMAFENRFEQYDVAVRRPKPLVPRQLRWTVQERLAADGEVLEALDEDACRLIAQRCQAEGIESVAIGFLHSYANPSHEQRMAQRLSALLPDVSISLSSSVCPEVREYERFSTTCANAYVQPLMSSYLSSLEAQLAGEGVKAPLLLMSSSGGLTTVDAAKAFPIRLVESGPAGGAVLASSVAQRAGWRRVLSFDMGGTTAKICLINDGQPQLSRSFEVDRVYRFKKGSGLPVRIPVVEMVEIGAGGGSIASMDRLGRVQVGPESAGSEPGPAAYGQGGRAPTVTDADLLLGKLREDGFAGGRMRLDASAAAIALSQLVDGDPARARRAAFAVSETVDENMALAARAHAAEWGEGLEDRTLIAFGGAAPLHAARLAQKLRMRRVVVPADAGVGSAVGFLLAPVSFEVVRSEHVALAEINGAEIGALLGEMRREAEQVVRPAAPEAELNVSVRAYMRYVGQGFEIDVAVDPDAGDVQAMLSERFAQAYRKLYGRTLPGQPIEILSWTVTVSAPPLNFSVRTGELAEAEPVQQWVEGFDGDEALSVRVIERHALQPGETLTGPAIVSEAQTTTVVPEGFVVFRDEHGQLILEAREGT